MLFPLEQERIRHFCLVGPKCPDREIGYSYLLDVVAEIVEEGRDSGTDGSVRTTGEVVQ